MAVNRTTPSMGRILALLAGTAGLGFGSAALAQRRGHEPRERYIPVRVAQRVAPQVAHGPKPKGQSHFARVVARQAKPHHATAPPNLDGTPASSPAPSPAPVPAPPLPQAVAPAPAPASTAAQASVPTLQAPAQAPAAAVAAPAPVVSGAS